MQQHSLHRKTLPWSKLRSETFAQAAGARSTVETYPAIRFALGKLGDHHSFLQLSPELQAKEKAALAKRNVPEQQAGPGEKWPPSPYFERHTPEGSLRQIAGVRVATVVVPVFAASDAKTTQKYLRALQSAVSDLAKQNPDGWIVDLRGNLGGNMWPMLAGVGPLVGDGPVGFFRDANNQSVSWFYSANQGAGTVDSAGKRVVACPTQDHPAHFEKLPPVAVLVDRGTASSGEAIAIAFRGRPHSRSFGTHTHGQSTSNEGFALPDGANLVLTTGVEADRTGRIYPDGIQPDVLLPEEQSQPQPGTIDPVTHAAAEWIGSTRHGSSSLDGVNHEGQG